MGLGPVVQFLDISGNRVDGHELYQLYILKSSWTQNGVHQWHSRIFPSSLLVPRTFAQPQAWVDAVVHQVLADQAVWVRCLAGTCLSLPATGGPFPCEHSHPL